MKQILLLLASGLAMAAPGAGRYLFVERSANVEEGEATLVTSGEMVDAKTQKPGEQRGTSGVRTVSTSNQ
jgi:hypothetical protein